MSQPPKSREPASERAGSLPQGRLGAQQSARLSPLRELQLAERARAGDGEALAEILRAYERRIYSICYRMLRREDEARDLTQDAIIKFIEGLHTYDGRAKLSTWVIRVTMNCCLSHLRKQRVRRHQSLDAVEAQEERRTDAWRFEASRADPRQGGAPGPPGSGRRPAGGPGTRGEGGEPSVLGRVEHGEAQAAVLRGLSRLDPEARAILVLRDIQDLEYDSIAEVLEVPLGTVKSRLFRAREALRREVESELGPPDGR